MQEPPTWATIDRCLYPGNGSYITDTLIRDATGILLNVQTVKDMGTPKIIAISNQDASKAQMTTWLSNVTE
jgi:hypothetical protein